MLPTCLIHSNFYSPFLQSQLNTSHSSIRSLYLPIYHHFSKNGSLKQSVQWKPIVRMEQTIFSFDKTIFGNSMNGVGKFGEKFLF